MDGEYLQHYGVLGMRWGVRKSKKNEPRSYRTKVTKKKGKVTAKITGSKEKMGSGKVAATAVTLAKFGVKNLAQNIGLSVIGSVAQPYLFQFGGYNASMVGYRVAQGVQIANALRNICGAAKELKGKYDVIDTNRRIEKVRRDADRQLGKR